MVSNKMFQFIERIFITAIAPIGLNCYNTMKIIPLKYVSVSNQ